MMVCMKAEWKDLWSVHQSAHLKAARKAVGLDPHSVDPWEYWMDMRAVVVMVNMKV